MPFGLSGLDYYSYPRSLLTAPRGFGRKTLLADNVSGLRPIGFGGRKTAIIADPTTSQFSVGDAQIRSFGGRRLYRTGLSPVPFGLSGLDYYSYPKTLLTRGNLFGSGLGQTKILTGGGFTAGDAQINSLVADPIGQEKVIVESGPAIAAPAIQEVVPQQVTTVVEDGGFGARRVTTVQSGGGLRGGNIILRGGPALGLRRVKSRPIVQAAAPVQEVLVDATSGLGAPIGGFGQRQVVAKTVAPAPVVVAPAPAPFVARAPARVVVAPAPAPIVTAPVVQAPIAAPIVRRRLGEAFLTQAARPLVAARRVATLARPVAISQPAVSVVNQIPPFPGNVQFTLGGTQIIGGPAIAPAAPVLAAPVVAAPRPVVVQRPVVAAVQRPVVAAVQRPAVVLQRPAVAVQRPVVAVQQPVISQVKTAGFGARRVLARRIPQMVYVDGGSRFPGIDIIGGYRIGDPRYNYARLPISTSRFANLGLSQGSIDAGPILTAPAPVPALLSASPVTKSIAAPITKTIAQAAPLGIAGIGATSPAKVVTQEEVIGPSGQTEAVVTTVREAGPSKIGGPVVGGLSGIGALGATGGTKTITQEEVIGPAGDSQIVTTVTKSGPSKIGGAAIGAPLGLTAVGQAPVTKTVTQEEVIGPAGDSQIVTTVTKSAPSKIGGPVVAAPLGLSAVGQAPAKVVTQEEVIGPSGETEAVVTTVTETGPSKIGGAALGGLPGIAALGATGGSKTITQEEVIGPAGDSQIVTTVTETAGAPSKIGGAVLSNPLGLSAVGQAPTKVITQEEVVGPAGDSQVITTVSETSPVVQQEEVVGLGGVSSLTASPLSQEITQDPIETAIAQETLGDSGIISSGASLLSPLSQTAVDPIGSGQTQLAVDDVFGPSSGSVTTITEQASVLPDGSVGTTVTKVTEVAQQPIADPVVQQSIDAGGIGGGGFGGYVPRVSFLSQFPYDIPSRALLRQAVTRPVVQEQQQLEQILV